MSFLKPLKTKWALLILFSCICRNVLATVPPEVTPPTHLSGAIVATAAPEKNAEKILDTPSLKPKLKSLEDKNQNSVDSKSTKKILLLPLITFFDQEAGVVYNWWAEHPNSCSWCTDADKMFASSEAIAPWSWVPVSQSLKVPESLQKTALQKDDMIKMAQRYGASAVVVGDVVVKKSSQLGQGKIIKSQWTLFDTNSGREIVSTSLVSEVDDPGSLWSQDSISKTFIADSSINLRDRMLLIKKKSSSTHMELVMSGNISERQLQKVKQWVQQQIPELKTISQKAVGAQELTFDIEYTPRHQVALGNVLRGAKSKDFIFQVVQEQPDKILMDIKFHPTQAPIF